MAELISKREVSPLELVKIHLSRIERVNPQINAYVQVDAEGAILAAAKAEEAVAGGEVLGPLHGVPISIKSSIEVAGMSAEAGTKLRRGYVARSDAPLVHRLRRAG